MFKYHGRTAVITGAGSGLGLEFARAAGRRGMNLVLADIEDAALESARRELEAAGHRVVAVQVDISQAEQVAALADKCLQQFGVPQLLFNNAGVGANGLVWEGSVDDWNWVLGVNLWGVIHGIRSFVPAMIQAGRDDASYRGHVVNTASMAGLLNPPNMGLYNVSKDAVVSLSESLYHDLALVGANVGASVLCPYFVPTRIMDAERNRPGPVPTPTRSQQVGLESARRAVRAGKVSAAEVAAMTFDGIEQGRFYLYSHPHALGNLKARMQGMLESGIPPDPFAERPHVRDALREKLLAGAGKET